MRWGAAWYRKSAEVTTGPAVSSRPGVPPGRRLGRQLPGVLNWAGGASGLTTVSVYPLPSVAGYQPSAGSSSYMKLSTVVPAASLRATGSPPLAKLSPA
jgi:hypothetical protein